MCGERVALWERAGKFETNMQRACSKHAGDVREYAGMCGEHVANVVLLGMSAGISVCEV